MENKLDATAAAVPGNSEQRVLPEAKCPLPGLSLRVTPFAPNCRGQLPLWRRVCSPCVFSSNKQNLENQEAFFSGRQSSHSPCRTSSRTDEGWMPDFFAMSRVSNQSRSLTLPQRSQMK